jgi:glycosyltransferase involved in cell wall biosynthesis
MSGFTPPGPRPTPHGLRILYASQYFPPEMGAPPARVHELSREWVKLGHDVTVLTAFPHHPTGIKRRKDHGVLMRRESLDGIDVLRSYVYAAPNKGTLKRMVSYASFMLSATLIGSAFARRPDLVLATSPQLLCALAGYNLSRRFGVPFVFELRDLWPESILAVEAMRENLIVRSLKQLARFLYNKADRIVAVGEGYKQGVMQRYGIDPAKIDVVPNGFDPSTFVPGPRDNDVRRSLGWGNRFVAMYIGTHGMAHALEKVLDAARELRSSDPDVLIAFVGEGAEKDKLKEIAARDGLDNVQFVDQQPKTRVPLFYAACDIGLVTLRNTPLFLEVLPSKIFEYLAMERPILFSGGGEAKMLIEKSGAGRCIPPEDPRALVTAIRDLKARRDDLAVMGRKGREFVEANYDRRVLARRYAEILRRVAQDSRLSQPTS